MPDSVSPTAVPAASPAPVREIAEEIRGGLQCDRGRRDEARKCLEVYAGDFSRYKARPDADRKDYGPERTSLVMQRVVNILTQNLYRDGPKRTLDGHDAATEWLAGVYRANCVDALMQHADRMAATADAAMFQVLPTPDPLKPVRVLLWDASQFAVWLDPEDQTRPVAVGVLDMFNEQRRCRLWTDQTVTTFLTKPLKKGDTAGGTSYEQAGPPRANDLGFLPFSFVHWAMPVCDFWTPGPGSHLAAVNLAVNARLTQNNDSITVNLDPILKGKNVPRGWTPPPKGPGALWFVPPNPDADGERGADADFEYLQADPSFIAASWDDLQAYLDHTLEMAGVPPATVRMVQDAARSGVSIIAEQAPLVLWAEGRQRPFAYYEDQLASLVLRVGARHLGAQDGELLATAADLEAAAADPDLTLRWPRMYPDMPGAEQDQSDQWLLDNHMASRKQILMRRYKWTDGEAAEYLEAVAEDLAEEQKLFAKLNPATDDQGNLIRPELMAAEGQQGETEPEPEDETDREQD